MEASITKQKTEKMAKPTEQQKLYKGISRNFGRATKGYGMLENGDRILVALSGGKDSLTLLQLMAERSRIYKPKISVVAAHVTMINIPYKADIAFLKEFCDGLGVEFHLLESGFDASTDTRKSPCFLCSWNRRKALFTLAQELGCKEEEIVGADLYVFNRMSGTVWGAEGEFFSAPRIDNLMCAFGTLQGFTAAGVTDSTVNVYYCADNEETGSSTKQGAGSVFLSDVVDRICETLNVDRRRLLASSFMVSADNGHALHPNHPELSDGANAPRLNGGVVIKTNAAQKYATEGLSAALFAEICRRSGVPVQYYANRSDQPGGSTLGSISNTLVPICTVDIGMAQLSMHSSYETAGCADVEHLIRAMEEFYQTEFYFNGDASVALSMEREGEQV